MRSHSLARSDAAARLLLDVMVAATPERASELGAAEADERVVDLSIGPDELADRYAAALREVENLRRTERDPAVARDLDILVEATSTRIALLRAQAALLPYVDVARVVFEGIRALLDERTVPGRRRSALRRLHAYAGLGPGMVPVTVAAERRFRRAPDGALLGPYRPTVERDVSFGRLLLAEVAGLFERFAVDGYDVPMLRLREQFEAYVAFVRAEVLPRARDDFRLPPELYACALREYGVTAEPADVARRARHSFARLRAAMEAMAPDVARARGWDLTTAGAVIAALRREQLEGDAILALYRTRLAEIETIVRRERIAPVPVRPAQVRLATLAESAVIPSPHLRLPRLIDNEGEYGEFVLPLILPAADGAPAQRFEDFTYAALAWPIAAHEARPGHELQLGAITDRSVSMARSVFALNSVNVEGWALYAESLIEPFMPPEGQLATLQTRAWRAARAFLDPELQAGAISPQEAACVLTDEVGLTAVTAAAELRRYTEIAPGQATSYYEGFEQFAALRREMQAALGPRFDQYRYHDAIFGQGFIAPWRMRLEMRERFGLPSAS